MQKCLNVFINQENILSFFVKRYKPASLFQSNQPEKNIYDSHPIPNPSISVAFSKATSTELTNKSAVCEVRGRRPGSFPTGEVEAWEASCICWGRPPWNCHKTLGRKAFQQFGKKGRTSTMKATFLGFISLALREGIPDIKSVCTLWPAFFLQVPK